MSSQQQPPPRRSPVVLGALIGFIVLFSTLMSGWAYFESGLEKWGTAAWTGDQAGLAVASFLDAATAKATKSPANPRPEVMPLTRWFNEQVFATRTAFFGWLVVLGELLLPIAGLALVVVRFPGSRLLLIAIAALAAFMNFLILSEGISSTNPPMVFMRLAILWLAATVPAAALFYAVDLRARVAGRPSEAVTAMDVSLPQWAFFVIVLVVVVAGALAMYGDVLIQFVVLTLVSLLLAYGLDGLNTRLLDQPRHLVAASP